MNSQLKPIKLIKFHNLNNINSNYYSNKFCCSCGNIQECFSLCKRYSKEYIHSSFTRPCTDKNHYFGQLVQNRIYFILDYFLNEVNFRNLNYINYLLFDAIDCRVVYYKIHRKFHNDYYANIL